MFCTLGKLKEKISIEGSKREKKVTEKQRTKGYILALWNQRPSIREHFFKCATLSLVLGPGKDDQT